MFCIASLMNCLYLYQLSLCTYVFSTHDVSEEHLKGPYKSVCRFFLGGRQHAWPGIIVAQQWGRGPIIGTHLVNSGNQYHCWSTLLGTVSSDHISGTMTYAIWREERLWNVGLLQRVHFSNVVIYQHQAGPITRISAITGNGKNNNIFSSLSEQMSYRLLANI